MITIALDAMGGDDAPDAIVRGAADASLATDSQIVLVGDERRIQTLLGSIRHDPERLRIEHAGGVIPMDASPKDAVEKTPDASMLVAAQLASPGGGCDALVSAGNTGALILSCARHFARMDRIRRTAFAAVIPTERRRGEKNDPFSLLLDVGATTRVEAEDLASFGLMGAAYAHIVSKNPRPKVALLSNGSEPTKGTEEIVRAHALLRRVTSIDFIGNIEGIDITRGAADVIVCDGFTGNIALKMLEGVHDTVQRLGRYAFKSHLTWRLGLFMLSGAIKSLKQVTDWQQYGGAPILGFDRLCIKAHGRSGPRAIRNALKVAERCVRQDLSGKIAAGVAELAVGGPASEA